MIDLRMPEHGRIRLGMETTFSNGKRGPTSIETFRFTSTDRDAIELLARQHGGAVRPWRNDKASIASAQWEVISRTNEITVLLPPNAISITYEVWGGGGIERRCDGTTCELYVGDDTRERPCICIAQNALECKPYMRRKVVLPDIPFGGIWRMETKGKNAAAELPAMEEALRLVTSSNGLLPAKLTLEKRVTRRGGKKKIYVVPRLSMLASVSQLMSGERVALGGAAPAALPSAPPDHDARLSDAKGNLDLTDEAFEEALLRTCNRRELDYDMVLDDLVSGVARIVQLNADGTLRLARGRTT